MYSQAIAVVFVLGYELPSSDFSFAMAKPHNARDAWILRSRDFAVRYTRSGSRRSTSESAKIGCSLMRVYIA